MFGVLCSHFILYIVDSVPFGEGLSMNYTISMKRYLFIAIIIAEKQHNFFSL